MTDFEHQCLAALFSAYGPEELLSYLADFCEDEDYPGDAEAIRGALAQMKHNDEHGLSWPRKQEG